MGADDNKSENLESKLCRCGHLRRDHSEVPTRPEAQVCDIPGCWCGGFELPVDSH